MLRSLLLSGDDNTVRIVRRGFKDLEVGLEHFAESDAALLHLTKNRYDAIVVDDQIEEAHIVVEQLIALPACNKSVPFCTSRFRPSASGKDYALSAT